MRLYPIAIAVVLSLWGVGAAAADGAGVCVQGVGGVSWEPIPVTGTYVGLTVYQNGNVGQDGNFDDFEDECCAALNEPPDCFTPVA